MPSVSPARDHSIALLFLTYGEVNNPEAWAQWLRKEEADKFSVYVHAKEANKVQHDLFRRNLVKAVDTAWGRVSLVRAHLVMLREALKESKNEWFVLLSNSCLPMVSFETLFDYLNAHKGKSFFDLHKVESQRFQRENFRRVLEEKKANMSEGKEKELALLEELASKEHGETIQAHSQWCILCREDAKALAEAQDAELWLSAFDLLLDEEYVDKSLMLAPDELLPLTYLRYHARRRGERMRKVVNIKVTYSWCCLDGGNCSCDASRAKHPQSFSRLMPELVRQCCDHNSLFARKFEPKMEVDPLVQLWQATTGEEKVTAAKYSDWMADPSRLSERQQLELVMYMSMRAEKPGRRPSLPPPSAHGAHGGSCAPRASVDAGAANRREATAGKEKVNKDKEEAQARRTETSKLERNAETFKQVLYSSSDDELPLSVPLPVLSISMKPNVACTKSKPSLAYDSDEDDLPLTFELPRKPNVACPKSKPSLAYDSDEDDLPLTFELPRKRTTPAEPGIQACGRLGLEDSSKRPRCALA